MSSEFNKTVRDFAKALQNAGSSKTSPYDVQAEVKRVEGDTAWVHFPGGIDETPVQLTTSAKKGDIVQVRVSGGRAWMYGNATAPPTDDTKANEVGEDLIKTEVKVYETITITEKKIYNEIEAARAHIDELIAEKADITDLTAATARITTLESDHVSVADLNASNARIGTLEADHVSVSDFQAEQANIDALQADHVSTTDLAASNARIGTLESDHVSTTDLAASNARIGTLEADHVSVTDFQAEQANIDNLQAATADIATIRADSAKVHNLTAAQLEADHATVGSLSTNYAQIDLANVNNAWIENGLVKNAAIGDAQISGVSANKLTAGTIDASNITVTNLNASNITTGTINGQRIGTGSLSLDKLADDVYTETEIDGMLSTMQSEIDGAIETYTGTVVPTLNNTPASSWTTTALKDKHVGDVYYVVNNASDQNGYCYRFTKSGSTYSWVLIKDSDVTAALQRLTEAEGDISGLQQFESTTSSWITNTDDEITSLKSRTTSVETSLGDKVDTSTFNTLSQTVDSNTSNITSLTTTVNSKADSSTVTTLSNTVNSVQQTANSNSSKISSLTTTLGTNADGTTKTGDIVHRTSAVEQDLSGFKTTVSQTYQTKSDMSNYSTTTQMNSAISQSASGVLSTVSSTYATQSALDDVEDSIPTKVSELQNDSNFATETYADGKASAAQSAAISAAASDATSKANAAQSAAEATAAADATSKANAAESNAKADAQKKLAAQYATSSTAAGTTAKIATIVPAVTGWSLYTGASITVKFTNANTTSAPTLNVNSTGAKTIKTYSGSALSASEYSWPAGATMSFVYDGTYWCIQDSTELTRIKSAETSITQTADSIVSLASNQTTYTKPDGTTATNTIQSAIKQNADNIELKVSKDGVIASINASVETSGGSNLKIYADKVNIEGATIFTSGRLSTSSLNSTYASTTAAIAEEQRIYYRSSSSTKPNGTGLPTSWITETGDKYNSNATTASGWSRKVTPIANGTGESVTKYLYLWTCIQKKTVSGTVTYGDILLDDSTTVIDGGKIITNSVTANQIDATSINASSMLTIGALDSDTQDEILNQNVSVPTTVSELTDSNNYTLKTIFDTLNNYVNAHMVLTDNELSILSNDTAAKITLGLQGLSIYGTNGLAAQYGSDAIIGDPTKFHIRVTPNYNNTGEGRLSFYRGPNSDSNDDPNEVAYISGNKLYITQSVVLQQMDIGTKMVNNVGGQWSWKVHSVNSKNNLYLKWLG